MREAAQSFGIWQGLYLMEHLQIRKVINIYLCLEDNHNVIFPQFYSPDIRAEGKLPNTTALVIIPDHHLVGRIMHIGATTYKSKDVAAEQHLNYPEPTTLQIPPESLLKRVAVKDSEAIAGASSEATTILIPRNRQQPNLLVITATCLSLARRYRQWPCVRGLERHNFLWGM